MKSFSMVCIPLIPRPPLFWALKFSMDIRLIYPRCVMVRIVFSLAIISSISISLSSYPMLVLLSSPNFSAVIEISFLITPRSNFSSARIALYSSISFTRFACSSSSLFLSRPVRARSLISTMASACSCENSNLSINLSFASAVV